MAESIVDLIELENGDQFAVTIEWSPDPKVIEEMMLKAANDFEDWSIPLEAARELMIEATKDHFATETDPFGVAWAQLDSDYRNAKQKMGAPDEILVLTGDMKEAATAEENWIMTKHSVFFNTAALPSYAPVHQEGTAPPGATEAIRSMRKGESLTKAQASAIMGEGSGNNTPKRAFLGIDYASFDGIEQIFIEHMDRTVTDYIEWVAPIPGDRVTTSAGFEGTLTNIRVGNTGGFRVRGVGGRFVKGLFHL